MEYLNFNREFRYLASTRLVIITVLLFFMPLCVFKLCAIFTGDASVCERDVIKRGKTIDLRRSYSVELSRRSVHAINGVASVGT